LALKIEGKNPNLLLTWYK